MISSEHISRQSLSSLALPYLKGPVTDIALIKGQGLVNEVWVVYAGKEKLIVRMNRDRGLGEFEKEFWCMEQARKKKVSVPRVLSVGQLDEWNYMIQNHAGDFNGQNAPGLDKDAAWRWLGECARKIHSVPTKGFGEILSDEEEGLFGASWYDYLGYNINSLNEQDPLLEMSVFSQDQQREIKNIFQSMAQTRYEIGLCHGDLSLENLVIDDAGNKTLIDWGCAHSHVVPYYDLAQIQLHVESGREFIKNYLYGYGVSEMLQERWLDETEKFCLLRDIDLVRWAKDRKPQALPEKIEILKKRLLAMNWN